ncbi:MAG: cytochrome c [Bacteroidia bacterium]
MTKSKTKILKTTSVIMVALTMIVFIVVAQNAPWKAPEAAAKVKNPVVSDAASLAAAKIIYTKQCGKCHGKKGMGDGPNAATLDKPVDPLNNAATTAQTDGELFWKISEGKKPMPSTKKSLSDEQRWQLVNYVRTFSSATK